MEKGSSEENKEKEEKINMAKRYNKKGYLKSVTNTKGRKKPAYIAQTVRSGFVAKYSGSNKLIKKNIKNPEKYATTLARKGHKKVSFRD